MEMLVEAKVETDRSCASSVSTCCCGGNGAMKISQLVLTMVANGDWLLAPSTFGGRKG